MKRIKISFIALALMQMMNTNAGYAQTAASGPTWLEEADVKTSILNNKGQPTGTAYLKKATAGMMLFVDLKNLPAGAHGMHFHSKADCSDHEAFKSAGAHVMPSGKPHGFFHADGPHEGNLPNLMVHADGTAQAEFYTNMLTLNGEVSPLQDADGSALIIHKSPDDHLTQPIGNSGARLACALITTP